MNKGGSRDRRLDDGAACVSDVGPVSLLGFAAAVLAYNVLALLQRAAEQAHQPPPASPPSAAPLEVSCFHLAQQVRSGYEGLLIALPPEHWPRWHEADPAGLARHLLRLARNINPRQVATSKCGPKTAKPKGYVDGRTARAHVATARVLAQAEITPWKGWPLERIEDSMIGAQGDPVAAQGPGNTVSLCAGLATPALAAASNITLT